MPEAAISTELVQFMANVGFVLEGFKDKKYNDRNDRINMKHLCLEYWLTGKLLLKF